MGKSLGIAAFIILLLSLPIPVLGNYISLVALIVLCVAAYQGEKTWTITVDVIAWVKMFLLSPTWHLMMFGGGYMNGMNRELTSIGAMDPTSRAAMEGSAGSAAMVNTSFLLLTLAILAAPIAILVWRSRRATVTSSDLGGEA